MKGVRYEMLGAPTLLYRHNHTNNNSSNDQQQSSSNHQNQQNSMTHHHQERFHPETLTPQQIHMNDYLEEHPFRKWFLKDRHDGKKKKKAMQQKRSREESNTSCFTDGLMERTFQRYKSSHDNNDNENSNRSDEEDDNNEGPKSTTNDSSEQTRVAMKYYTFDFDKSDIPPKYLIATHANETNNDIEDNDNNDDDGNIIVDRNKVVVTEEQTTRKNEVGGPLGYGNCLVAITCTCHKCFAASTSPSPPAATVATTAVAIDEDTDSISNDKDTTFLPNPTSFLVHPVGETLSFATIDKLILPRDEKRDYYCTQSPLSPPCNSNTLDVGGTILQIAICGMGVTNKVKRMNQEEEDCQSECLVVRTARYCVVILAKACSNNKGSSSSRSSSSLEGEAHSTHHSNEGNRDDDSLSSTKREEQCSTTFELMELSRIDFLCKPPTQPLSYLPVSVTCDPKVVFSPFANPSFAILSRSNKEQTISGMDCTTIHTIVQFGDESKITKHTLSSLANISLIEYHASEMSVLWAAARATSVPKVYNKDKDGNTGKALRGGYGHSLFKINLRNDTASHVWSPSKAEYMSEGVHSINGIMNDLRHKHVVWVSSSSACKVWALDVRHNAANVVMCFSLAQLSDDFGPELGVAGLYGAGMIMMQPPSSINECAEEEEDDDDCSDTSEQYQLQQQDIPPTMFGLKKDPNTYSLHTYQLPTTMSRFHTMPLEASRFVEAPSVKYSTSCIARSNIYPLPICSDKTFRVGLATLRRSAKSALRKVDWKDTLGYDEAPDIIYALTMTSVGDIYCHALLECDSKREVQARSIEGPVGVAAISVPVGNVDDDVADGCLRILLSNDFPSPFNDVALF